ncbi:unnamed protein product [Protopolystoma xenopodis]|uniref:Uncharacterized protein n=1 Tax=Protopolystoma xenopodis TaxID=117903 RepID=A0A3S5BFW3_9PLAT|nr:unnamed protein product [Protopolystoma xenopodis]
MVILSGPSSQESCVGGITNEDQRVYLHRDPIPPFGDDSASVDSQSSLPSQPSGRISCSQGELGPQKRKRDKMNLASWFLNNVAGASSPGIGGGGANVGTPETGCQAANLSSPSTQVSASTASLQSVDPSTGSGEIEANRLFGRQPELLWPNGQLPLSILV